MTKPTKWIDAAPQEPVPEVAARTLRSRLEMIQEYLPRAANCQEENPEHLHQARVWTRRASAAVQVYRELLPKNRSRWLRKALRRIRIATNDARDADVFLARLAQDESCPGAAALQDRVRQLRHQAQVAVVDIDKRLIGTGRLTRRGEKLLRRVRWRGDAREQDEPGFGAWAPARLEPMIARFFETAAADLADVEALHQLRLAGKKLRYSMELLGAVFPDELRSVAYSTIQEIQDRLGAINDLVMAEQRLIPWLEQADTTDYARQQVEVNRDKLNRLRDEFFTWWIPQRREELHQLFNRLLTGTGRSPAPHPSGRAPGESDSASQSEIGTATS